MRLGQPDVQRQQPRLGAEADERQEERDARPRGPTSARARIAVERVVAAAALQHAEAEQDRDRADVRDQQVQEAGAADLGDPVLGRHEEVRRQRHRLPRDHEHVRVVGDQHQRHRRQERVVLEADEPRRRCLRSSGSSRPRRARPRRRAAPSSSRKNADSASRRRWNGRSGSPSGSTARFRRRARWRREPDGGERQPDRGARGKQHAADEAQAARPDEAQRRRSRATHDGATARSSADTWPMSRATAEVAGFSPRTSALPRPRVAAFMDDRPRYARAPVLGPTRSFI